MVPDFADGVWLAELAPLSEPSLVPVTVAVTLKLSLPDDAESPERVAAALGPSVFSSCWIIAST
jgi:predicted ATPase